MFLCDPCLGVILKTTGATNSVDFCTGVYEERTCAREAEESPLLDAVARERLVKL
jgi:hypothetical protein